MAVAELATARAAACATAGKALYLASAAAGGGSCGCDGCEAAGEGAGPGASTIYASGSFRRLFRRLASSGGRQRRLKSTVGAEEEELQGCQGCDAFCTASLDDKSIIVLF